MVEQDGEIRLSLPQAQLVLAFGGVLPQRYNTIPEDRRELAEAKLESFHDEAQEFGTVGFPLNAPADYSLYVGNTQELGNK